jgi:hypothetical protein
MKNTKSESLELLKDEAVLLMEKAGYPVDNIKMTLDEKLPFMGYTRQIDGMHEIVVSGLALRSEMALNLIIHEMGHVFRTQTDHPSHNSGLIFSSISWVMHGRAVHQYQENALFAVVNHLQDLYSDDIFFKIFDKDLTDTNINKFFLGWVHEPLNRVKNREDSWFNAGLMLSAAFAQANLHRHNVKDVDGLVEKEVNKFLGKIDKRMIEKYEFFKNFMITLPEKTTEKEYEKLLIKYLSEFIKIADIA